MKPAASASAANQDADAYRLGRNPPPPRRRTMPGSGPGIKPRSSRLGGAAAGVDPHRIGTGDRRQRYRRIAGDAQGGVDLRRGGGDGRAGRERRAGDENADEGEAFDDSALFQEQGRQSAERGERLRDLPGEAVGEMHTEQRQNGAETGIGGRLAKAREEIGEKAHRELHRATFRWGSKKAASRRLSGESDR